MKIRSKILLLAVASSLLPMLLVSEFYRFSISNIRNDVVDIAYESLADDAKQYLQTMVDDFGRIVMRDASAMRMSLHIQANTIEESLTTRPAAPEPIYYAAEFDRDDPNPELGELLPSERHARLEEGQRIPTPISYYYQSVLLLPNVEEENLQDTLDRIANMADVYQYVDQLNPDMLLWQHTTLAAGLHCQYPGVGGYPGNYDPRQLQRYIQTVEADGEYWSLTPDPITRKMLLSVTIPVHDPDGSIAGVTGVDVDVEHFLKLLTLPEEWTQHAAVMLLNPKPVESMQPPLVILRKDFKTVGRAWQKQVQFQSLQLDRPQDTTLLINMLRKRKSGVIRVQYKGKDCLCAVSQWTQQQPPALVLVPHSHVVAMGKTTERKISDRMELVLYVTGYGVTIITLLVILLAIRRAKKVSQPIDKLAQAGRRLAKGDFATRVDIRTKDELQALGDVFNSIGPKLQDRKSMKRSLALAKDIQQHLLPHANPQRPGLDIFGAIEYCDDTGGDYYDFLELPCEGEDKIGIAVGDITGHGVGAALLMASARAVLRSHATQYPENLAELFVDINEHLIHDTGDERFLTLFYGVLDVKRRTLNLASGGHDPLLWRHGKTGEIEIIPNTGTLLGVMPNAEFEQVGPLQLEDNDIMMVGTDGIWESENTSGEQYGRERLLQVLQLNASRSAKEIYHAVLTSVREFAGGRPPKDDITLVIIKALAQNR